MDRKEEGMALKIRVDRQRVLQHAELQQEEDYEDEIALLSKKLHKMFRQYWTGNKRLKKKRLQRRRKDE